MRITRSEEPDAVKEESFEGVAEKDGTPESEIPRAASSACGFPENGHTEEALLEMSAADLDEEAYMKQLHRYIVQLDPDVKTAQQVYEKRLELCKARLSGSRYLSGMGCYVELRAAVKESLSVSPLGKRPCGWLTLWQHGSTVTGARAEEAGIAVRKSRTS